MLLPDDLYEPWTEEARDALRLLHLDLLRLAGRWEDLLREDPADEEAHLALIRASADRGDVRGALRQFERMDQALRRDLGTAPSAEARAVARPAGGASRRWRPRRPAGSIRSHGCSGGARSATSSASGSQPRRSGPRGNLVLTGPPGVGKSAVLDLAEAIARKRGWRTGRGTASAVEGPWPYAPVLEASSDLCRRHPALCDGLPDVTGRSSRGRSPVGT